MDATKVRSSQYGYCRCCLTKGQHLDIKGEHYWNGVREVYADVIEECFGLSVDIDLEDRILLICDSCVQHVREASYFRTTIISSGKQLKRILEENDLNPDFNKADPIKIEIVKEENTDIFEDDQMDQNDNLEDAESSYFETKPVRKKKIGVKKDYETALKEFINRHAKALPKMNPLPKVLPKTFAKYCNALRDKTDLKLNDLLKLSHEKRTAAETLFSGSEKSVHLNNMETILKCSNVTPFKARKYQGIMCYYCRCMFQNLQTLKDHVKSNHVDFNLNQLLWKNGAESVLMYVDVSDMKCTICDESVTTLKELKNHLIDKHKKNINKNVTDRIVPFNLSSETNVCQICGFDFETFGTLERHMNTHFRNYICKECGVGFITKYRLKVHTKNAHYSGQMHVCEICKKEFVSQQKLKSHTEFVHNMLKRFKCPYCSERFNEYFKRQKHLVSKHGETPISYKCNVCFREFDKRYSLSKHLKKDHLEERNFQCDQCPYRCFSKHELLGHMIKHGGERIHECQVCRKAFARKKTLREHMRIHLDDKRFSCSVCGQSFIQKCSLKGHMKTHHPE